MLESCPFQVGIELGQVEAFGVSDEHGRKRRHHAGRAAHEGLSDGSVDILELLAQESVLAFLQMRGPEARQRILEFEIRAARSGGKVAGADVEELQENEKLLGRERAVPALDLAEPALREPEASGQVLLRPA